jgi:hypothetical protein
MRQTHLEHGFRVKKKRHFQLLLKITFTSLFSKGATQQNTFAALRLVELGLEDINASEARTSNLPSRWQRAADVGNPELRKKRLLLASAVACLFL